MERQPEYPPEYDDEPTIPREWAQVGAIVNAILLSQAESPHTMGKARLELAERIIIDWMEREET